MKELALTGYDKGLTTTVGSLTANLAELVGSMMTSGRSIVVIAEFTDHRYVQFLVRPGEGVFAEVISNLNIGDQVALSPTDEEALGRLGFDEPLAGASPNWSFHVDDGPGFVRLMGVMNRVIYQVLREVAGNAVEVRSWPAEVPSGMDTSDYRTLKRIYVEERQGECGAGDGDAPGPGESGS